MAILKCKMCGGTLEVNSEETIATCEYCRTQQTVPNVDDEKKLKLYERANKLRYNCDFDKAAGVYESIASEYSEEAEAYWGLLLCKYGIEYVDDSVTGKKIPTCHRSSFDSVMDDSDFEMVMENADSVARGVYRAEAKQIEEIRKGIIEVSGKEEPYDVFICYKETAEDGQRTIDSVLAQDVYDALTDKGYRVFFSRITLEDKLGHEYEPYIFAALNSAKVMLAFGTSYDHYNAVWVKNEWSRYLKLMEGNKEKYLIPCYKDIDAYDIPKEFAKLQAQDMGKVGAVQDLLRGIEKLIGSKETKSSQGEAIISQQNVLNANLTAALERGFLALEDKEWNKADGFFEQALNVDAKLAEAYLGKLMADLKVSKKEKLSFRLQSFSNNKNYEKILKFGDDELIKELDSYIKAIEERKTKSIYEEARELMNGVKSEDFKRAIELFESIKEHLDSEALMQECEKQIRVIQCQQVYEEAVLKMEQATSEQQFKEIAQLFDTIGAYKDAAALSMECMRRAKEIGEKLSRIKELLRKIKAFALGEIQILNESIANLREKREELEKEKSALRFFERKRAKEIEGQILELSTKIRRVRQRERLLKNDFKNYVCDNQNILQIYNELSYDPIGNEYLENYINIWMLQKKDTFCFGKYISNPWNQEKKYQEIEWLVLEIQNGKMLVISKDVLCVREFDEKFPRQKTETWGTSSLRRWLNEDFLNDDFSDVEKEMIAISDVVADGNPEFHISGGRDTQDKIFLPSVKEIDKYEIPLKPGVTDVAAREYRAQLYFHEREFGRWWLRSAGHKEGNFACVSTDLSEKSFCVNNRGLNQKAAEGVRPMMWIDLDVE